MREVHNTHRWAHAQTCKGCGVHIDSTEAQKECPTPYKPPPRLAKEYRKP